MANWSFWIDRGGTFTDTLALNPNGRILSSKFLSVNPEKYLDAAASDDGINQSASDALPRYGSNHHLSLSWPFFFKIN